MFVGEDGGSGLAYSKDHVIDKNGEEAGSGPGVTFFSVSLTVFR